MAKFRINGIPQSIRDLKTVSSASGSIATFDTDLTDNLVKCVADIQAVQSGSGTPSPDNVHSISGWQNVNVAKFSVTGNIPSDITVYNRYLSTGSSTWRYSSDSRSIAIPCLPNTTYIITGYPNDIGLYRFATIQEGSLPTPSSQSNINAYQLVEFTSYADIGKAYTFTTNSQATYIIIQVSASRINDFVENGTVAPSTSVVIALGQTVYGGYIDVTSGVLTITHGMTVYDGSSDEGWEALPSAAGFVITNSNFSGNFVKGISNLFPIRTSSETWTDYTSIRYGFGGSNPSRLCVFKATTFISGVTDVATWKTWLSNNNLMCVYKLAGNITVQLSSNQIQTLLGQNNILADTGDIDVEFLETVGNKIGG